MIIWLVYVAHLSRNCLLRAACGDSAIDGGFRGGIARGPQRSTCWSHLNAFVRMRKPKTYQPEQLRKCHKQ